MTITLPVISNLISVQINSMDGHTTAGLDFEAAGLDVAMVLYWLSTKQKMVARLATDEKTLWFGNVNTFDPAILRGVTGSVLEPDITFQFFGPVGVPITPINSADFNIAILTGRF